VSAGSPGGRGRAVAAAGAAAAAVLPVLAELRLAPAEQRPSGRWRGSEVVPRGATLLGVSLRTPQLEAMGADPAVVRSMVLGLPFDVVRLGAYWSRLERSPQRWSFEELDTQIDDAASYGKRVILGVGAVKNFGYPEQFVPAHQLRSPLPERALIGPRTHPRLLEGALAFIGAVVERYREHPAVGAWQVEHEAVDPLGLEHSWRLSESFVRAEIDVVRRADPGRPVILNGFLPTSLPVRAQQWWRTRDQGDSLAVASRLADVVGIDFYPRHGLVSVGKVTCYLDGSRRRWHQRRRQRVGEGRRVMVTEGQAEPWETVTEPPSPNGRVMYSCRPEDVISTYNQCMRWHAGLWAYLFWGAEYWVKRALIGDRSYLDAVARVLREA
jgi:hypothetical protein